MRGAAAAVGWVGTWSWPVLYLPHVLGSCTQGSEDPWLASLVIYLPALLLMLAVASLGIRGARWLRWLTLPHLITLLLALYMVTPYLWGTTILGHHLCTVRDGLAGFDAYERSMFAVLWAPLQFAALCVLGYTVYRTWHGGPLRA
jgi:hypothetical protein